MVETEAIRYKWESVGGSYPDYEKVIPTEFVAEARFNARDMLRAGASLSALDKDAPIILSITEGKVRLTVKNGVGEAEIEALTSGEAQTAISSSYLAQILKAVGGMLELKVKSPDAAMVFSIDGYRIAVMPLAVGLGRKNGEGEPEAVGEAPVEAVAEAPAEAPVKGKPKRKRTKEPVLAKA